MPHKLICNLKLMSTKEIDFFALQCGLTDFKSVENYQEK